MIDPERMKERVRATPQLKDATKRSYLSKIRVIDDEIGPLGHVLHHPEEFKERLMEWGKREELGQHTINSYYSAAMALFLHDQDAQTSHHDLFKRWERTQKEIREPIDAHYQTNEPTSRQREAYVSYEELMEIMSGLPGGSPERVLLSMYLLIPAVRSDYAVVPIYPSSSGVPSSADANRENYVVLGRSPKVVIQNHKTDGRYDRIVIPMPAELSAEIKESLRIHPRSHLFVSQRTGESYGKSKSPDNAFNKWANKTLSRVVKPGFTLTMFRHAWLSREDIGLCKTRESALANLARQMGHSTSQQKRYQFIGGNPGSPRPPS